MNEEKPFERRVQKVINEEFANARAQHERSEHVNRALNRIVVRLAADLEHLHQGRDESALAR